MIGGRDQLNAIEAVFDKYRKTRYHPTMNFKSHAQVGQDLFVSAVLPFDRETFLEIGSNSPVNINNTFVLEQFFNWRGLLVDNSGESMEACERERSSMFYLTDAAQPQNWLAALAQANLPTDVISYLSLDVDEATLDCLKNLPLDKVRFRVMTVEHDEYRKPGTRDAMVAILRSHGYDILCADVCDAGLSFEIWCVDPKLVDMNLAEKFRRDKPTDWKEMFVLDPTSLGSHT